MDLPMNSSSWIEQYFALLNNPDRPSKTEVDRAVSLRSQFLPNSLYRYRRCDEYAVDSLQNGTVWLSAPNDFNDPFDSCLSVLNISLIEDAFAANMQTVLAFPQWDSVLSKSDKDAIFASSKPLVTFGRIAFAKSRESVLSIEQFEQLYRNAIKKPLDSISESLNNLIRKNLRVCCFTEVPDSILMWSHYGDFHRGFCIEYDTASITSADVLGCLHPVNYRTDLFDATEYLRFVRLLGHNNWMAMIASCHKSPSWSYEREWRLVLSDSRSFLPLRAKAMILGACIDPEKEKLLKRVGHNLGISISQVSLARDKFELIIKAL